MESCPCICFICMFLHISTRMCLSMCVCVCACSILAASMTCCGMEEQPGAGPVTWGQCPSMPS